MLADPSASTGGARHDHGQPGRAAKLRRVASAVPVHNGSEDAVSQTDEVQVISHVTLPPDPRLFNSLGRNHDLASALADLVDNSVDAGAQHVRIRFVRRDHRLIRLYVIDDGRGVGENDINTAMTIGGSREYGERDLGHFGLGLKAASFGHADELTMLSRTRESEYAGRRWSIRGADSGFACDVVYPGFCEIELSSHWPAADSASGTIIRWDGVRTFPAVSNARETNRFLTETIERIRRHLGLVFHRLIQADRVRISIDEYDLDLIGAGSAVPVDPLDPFEYSRSGHPDYPHTLWVDLDPPHELICHLWPPRASVRQFRLNDRPERHQGFYFYRHDRLIQAGGWNGVVHEAKELQLARVVVELDDTSDALIRLNPEKSRVDPTESFVHGAQAAVGDGVTFDQYLDDARALYKRGRRRDFKRSRVIPPGKGLPPAVKRVIRTELPAIPGEEPIDIRWERLPADVLFEIDRGSRVLWLNKRYRQAITGSPSGSLNDAPTFKACLYLLVEPIFQGHHLGARDKDNIELWQTVLSAAAQSELA